MLTDHDIIFRQTRASSQNRTDPTKHKPKIDFVEDLNREPTEVTRFSLVLCRLFSSVRSIWVRCVFLGFGSNRTKTENHKHIEPKTEPNMVSSGSGRYFGSVRFSV